MMNAHWKQLSWLILFSIAMGFLETSVVIYLRKIYYPVGFDFPLTLMDSPIVTVELLREAATIVMLVGVALLSGKSLNQRIAYFLVAFSTWDLFYYLFLKLMINWPESLFTWDILFLIPVPWIGPVLAPCIVSVTMFLLAILLLDRDFQNASYGLRTVEWLMLIIGSQIVVLSWTLDYFTLYFGGSKSAEGTLSVLSNFVPKSYGWWMFGFGEMFLIAGIFLFWKRTKGLSNNSTL